MHLFLHLCLLQMFYTGDIWRKKNWWKDFLPIWIINKRPSFRKNEDAKVIKTYPDGFNKTDLDKIIKEKGSNTLFLCGLSAVVCVLATWIGAQNNDYTAFLVKDAIMSHNSDYTNHVEEMFDAVGYDVVKLIVEKKLSYSRKTN